MEYAIRKNNYLGFDYYLCHPGLDPDFTVWAPVEYPSKYNGYTKVLFSKETAKRKVAKLNKDNFYIGVTYTMEEA